MGEDVLNLNLSNNQDAMKLLEGKKGGDRVSLKNLAGRLIVNEEGKVQIQVDELEFAGGQAPTQRAPDGEEIVEPPEAGENSPILVLLGVPDEEKRTDGANRTVEEA